MKNLTELFTRAGEAVNARWEGTGFAGESFAPIAEAALQDESPLVQVELEDLHRWILTGAGLPKQHDPEASFAQPPVTVYRNDKFHIAFLFWTTSSTTIHQHAFEGAFRVFLGSSIQARYDFTEAERWGEHLLGGRLEVRSLELLPLGRTCAIPRGASFIHSAFHLDHPSVTLIIRTHDRPDQAVPQYNYLAPGLAVDAFHRPETLERAKQLLWHLHQIADPQFVSYVDAALDANDAYGAFAILNHLGDSLPPDQVARMTHRLGERFGARFSGSLPLIFRETQRRNRLMHARKTITDPEGRFFLALLLSTSDPAQFRSLLLQRFPEAKPEDVTARWVTELLKSQSLGIESSSFSGMLVRGLLSGLSVEAVLGKLAPILRTETEENAMKTHAEELAYLFRPALHSG